MTLDDVQAFGFNLLARLRKLPLSVMLVAATIALVAVVLAVVGFSGARYSVLFDGLSPARGGKVIAALQKEGIPYQLSQDGNVISVPSDDLGRARLRLGADGQPQTGSDASWQALENTSVTTSQAATQALQLQATESSLQASIMTLSGASEVQVLLAKPKDTPFLADQAKPKASVILTGAPQADDALGLSIAKIVAGAVPGLSEDHVVVATSRGTILYPVSNVGDVAQQLAVVRRIEAAQEAKIRSLLVPILGPGNSRVSVSADISFAARRIQAISYGPKSVALSSEETSKTQYGRDPVPMGIPGALSNQPPGPTTAPLNGNGQKESKQASTPPRSDSHQSQKTYAVDKTSTTEQPAIWLVKKVNASVVVNKAALGKLSIAKLTSMIRATIAVPVGQIDVTSSDFVTKNTALAGAPGVQMSRIMQAALLLIAAIGFLFGVVRPLVGWLREAAARPPSPAPAPAVAVPEQQFQENLELANLRSIAGQVAEVGIERPEMMAAALQRWLSGGAPGIQTEDVG